VREVEVGGAHEDPGDDAAVLVDVHRHDMDISPEDERGHRLLGRAAEGLAELRGVDAVEPQANGAPLTKDADRVAVVHGNHAAVEGCRKRQKKDKEGRIED
jgi:hypothetical protein